MKTYEEFKPKKHIAARYAKKMVNKRFYNVYYPIDDEEFEKEKAKKKKLEDFYDANAFDS